MANALHPVAAGDSDAAFDVLMRDGYVVVKAGVPSDLVNAVNADLDDFKRLNRRAIAANLDEAGRMRRVVNLHLVIDSLATVFASTKALAICDRFFGRETVLYTSIFFERGSEQGAHRDAPLFVTRPPGQYLGVWAALEDVDSENGALLVIPGSHDLPAPDLEAMATELYGDPGLAPPIDDAGWNRYQETVQAQADAAGLRPTEVHVAAGDVIVWHPLLLHGGVEHRSSQRTRRSFVMHVTPPDTPVHHQDVFFNPSKPVAIPSAQRYDDRDGRRLIHATHVDFAHQYMIRPSGLVRPGSGLIGRLKPGRLRPLLHR